MTGFWRFDDCPAENRGMCIGATSLLIDPHFLWE